MRIIQDERHIRVRSVIGKYLSLAGIVILLVGLVISFVKPEWMVLLMTSMVLGIAFSLLGTPFTERYVGPLAHHDALAGALKGLDNQYVLLQYVLPASHVLLGPGGLTAFVVKTHGGQVICQEGGRWKHRDRGKVFRQITGQPGLGLPGLDAEHEVEKLKRWLADRLPGVEVPVRAAIVFVNPNVDLDAAASPVPVFYGKKVKAWLRGPGKRKSLPAHVRHQLVAALDIDT